MKRITRWLLAVSMAANQLVNALTGGDPDMAVSARAAYARERDSKTGRLVCRILEAVDVHPFSDRPGMDHCDIAKANHERRIQN
jgi:hypothetical protein